MDLRSAKKQQTSPMLLRSGIAEAPVDSYEDLTESQVSESATEEDTSFYDMVDLQEDPLAERTQNIVAHPLTDEDEVHSRSLLSQQKDRWIETIRRECEEVVQSIPLNVI